MTLVILRLMSAFRENEWSLCSGRGGVRINETSRIDSSENNKSSIRNSTDKVYKHSIDRLNFGKPTRISRHCCTMYSWKRDSFWLLSHRTLTKEHLYCTVIPKKVETHYKTRGRTRRSDIAQYLTQSNTTENILTSYPLRHGFSAYQVPVLRPFSCVCNRMFCDSRSCKPSFLGISISTRCRGLRLHGQHRHFKQVWPQKSSTSG